MPKEIWGSKHLCENCGTKFYDLQRSPVECPECGDHLEVFFKETQNNIPDDQERGVIDISLDDSTEESVKSDSDDDIEDDVDDILDNDEDTVSLDEIKNITTENTD